MTSPSCTAHFTSKMVRVLTQEQKELIKDPPEGIQIVVNDFNVTEIQAIIDGPEGTPYSGGRFNVNLVLGKDFPNKPPKAYFLTKIFHPNVASNGEICVNILKMDWKPDLGIRHVLLTIKCLLIEPNAESALNEEAGKLLLEEYDQYFQRAKMITDIHAQVPNSMKVKREGGSSSEHASSKKHVGHAGSKPFDENISKNKNRTLKRL